MLFLEKIDLWILDSVFQKLADWIQEYTGKTCWFAGIVSVWVILGGEFAFYLEGKDRTGYSLFWIIIITINLLWLVSILEKRDKKEHLVVSRTMNPSRSFIPYGCIRLMLLVFAFLSTLSFIVEIAFPSLQAISLWFAGSRDVKDIGYLCYAYFLSCTPRPPTRLRAGNALAVAVIKTA